jgi:hypothetical protein
MQKCLSVVLNVLFNSAVTHTVSVIYEYVWSIGGVILTGENGSAAIKTCLIVTLSTTNIAWTGLGSSPGLSGDRLVTNRLSRGTVH